MYRFTTLFVAVLITSWVAMSPAQAGRKPEDVFAGKILTSRKMFPTRAKSKAAYIRKVRKLKVTKFDEDEDRKRWKVYYAAFFRKPVRGMELKVRLYDITATKTLKLTFDEFLMKRGMRSFVSKMTLTRDEVGVNRRFLMVIEDLRGKTIASTKFWLYGKVKKRSGKVDFTK